MPQRLAGITYFSTRLKNANIVQVSSVLHKLLFRPDGRESCSIEWKSANIFTDGDVLTEQTAFTFYSLVFGFLGPLVFTFIFYLLVLIRFSTHLTSHKLRLHVHILNSSVNNGVLEFLGMLMFQTKCDIFNVLIVVLITIGMHDRHCDHCHLVM